jgi:hypothetical protein
MAVRRVVKQQNLCQFLFAKLKINLPSEVPLKEYLITLNNENYCSHICHWDSCEVSSPFTNNI